jgi:hypothetical protein
MNLQRQDYRSQDWSWSLWPVVPLYPYGKRRTLRQEVVPDTIWTFDQIQGIFYVVVPIRMTVIRLEAGGLFVYAPVAPTPECIRLVRELEERYGPVKYIVLPTVSGLEHKVFVGPFARCFATAHVFVAPKQWSYPVRLPLSWLGFPRGRTHVLPTNSTEAPFADEFDYEILGPLDLGLGNFGEVVFFHRRSHSLLVTDVLVSVPETPPEIVQLDPYPLLFHARDTVFDVMRDDELTRRKGWQRISLFAFYFRPSKLKALRFWETLRKSFSATDRSRQSYFGLFPFEWQPGWQESFQALRANPLLVAPILQTLILNRAPVETLNWADRVACWTFQRILPCHFDSPIQATAEEFRQAFAFLEADLPDQTAPPNTLDNTLDNALDRVSSPLPEDDFELLKELEDIFSQCGIMPPRQTPVMTTQTSQTSWMDSAASDPSDS